MAAAIMLASVVDSSATPASTLLSPNDADGEGPPHHCETRSRGRQLQATGAHHELKLSGFAPPETKQTGTYTNRKEWLLLRWHACDALALRMATCGQA